MEYTPEEQKNQWLDEPITSKIKLNKETLIIIAIILAAIVSRFYILGARVMSHDEINHVHFAYQFYQGGKYVHNPLTHGPLQFHLLELSYFLFNDSDFSARLPAAFFSIISVIFVFKYRRYLGRSGTITAAALFVISPFMLYYGRYARNEAIVIFFTLATIWSVLRYLDTGENKYLYLTAAFTALHYTTKETVFIFSAQLLVFLGLLFLYRIAGYQWSRPQLKKIFYILLLLSVLVLAAGFVIDTIAQPEIATVEEPAEPIDDPSNPLPLILFLTSGSLFLAAFGVLIYGYSWRMLTKERTFGMMIFQLTMVLPQLAAFVAFWLKIPMTEYSNMEVVGQVSQITAGFLIASIILGGLWKQKEWLIAAGIYYAIFIVFYTSIFGNLAGLYSGMIGSLGYWLEQHGVERGSQPWYYFALIQLPLYEYLAYLGTLIAGIYSLIWINKKREEPDYDKQLVEEPETGQLTINSSRRIALAMLLFFSLSSMIAYMIVGEKMPWLTVHISWSMWLVAGWLFGKLIDKIDWASIFTPRGFGIILAFFIAMLSIVAIISSLLQPNAPFSGDQTETLRASGSFLLIFAMVIISLYTIYKAGSYWVPEQLKNTLALSFILLLAISTIRHAYLASYVNYDNAKEYLVYAHAARGPKEAFEQTESISLRLTGGKDILVAFDNHTMYPFWWYFRDYPNRLEYGENPTRDLRNYPVIMVGDLNYSLIEPIVQDDYVYYEYPRMVWPNQDYFNLSFYTGYLSDPETRKPMLNALFEIWMNRNYKAYGDVTGQNMSLRYWNPSQSFRMYVRNDVAAQIWQYGTLAGSFSAFEDPYEEGMVDLSPLITLNSLNLNGAKDIAISSSGEIYIADTGNHRIIKLSENYEIVKEWGTEGANPGEFNQPWGLAIDRDGFVYVADTWNHRIQKFNSNGEFVTTWGSYGQAETGDAFWGPRDIGVDPEGNILITDTGNKRVAIFSSDGTFITEFGSAGYLPGELDEPVGLAISPVDNLIYIADTWNQRVQVFEYSPDMFYYSLRSWDIDGWYGQSLENKPFLSVDEQNRVIVADPESGRILVFTPEGEFINGFGEYDPFGVTGFGLIGGLATAPDGGIWVVDSLKNEVKYFVLSPPGE